MKREQESDRPSAVLVRTNPKFWRLILRRMRKDQVSAPEAIRRIVGEQG